MKSESDTLSEHSAAATEAANLCGPSILIASLRELRARKRGGLFTNPEAHRVLLLLSALHAATLLSIPSIWVIGLGLWWNANTVAHNFIHKPFFKLPALNHAYSGALTLLLGVPQRLWRDRHLAHHAGAKSSWRFSNQLAAETTLIAILWAWLLLQMPGFFLYVYFPGLALGLFLCHLQGHYEHVRGTTSHYGKLYNWLFFNDGYHIEHHARPGLSWRKLPSRRAVEAQNSRWPAVLRWLDTINIENLEAWTTRFEFPRRFLIRTHRRAFAKLLPQPGSFHRVLIVGGALFPRTALILRELLPNAHITIVDASSKNIRIAEKHLPRPVPMVHARFDIRALQDYDLVVIPLSFQGDRKSLYRQSDHVSWLIHDWIWNPRGSTCIISWLLFKRLNLIIGPGA